MTLALLAAAWLAGLLVGLHYSAEPLPVFLLALATVPLALLLRIYGRSAGILIVLGLFLLGFWRPLVSGMPEPPLTVQEQQEVSISGRIVNDRDDKKVRPDAHYAVNTAGRKKSPREASVTAIRRLSMSGSRLWFIEDRPGQSFEYIDLKASDRIENIIIGRIVWVRQKMP